MSFLPQNAAHWHIILVHMPAAGLMFGLLLLWIASAFKDGRFQRVALAFMILTAAATYVTARTGHEAEEIVEHLRGISEELIHEHEEAAELGEWLMYGLGALALLVLIFTAKQKYVSAKPMLLVSVVTLGVAGYFYYVAKLGGNIHHEETRTEFVSPARGDHEHDDFY
jgi:uncharacterized membrane protein